jgi:hypothetical protein
VRTLACRTRLTHQYVLTARTLACRTRLTHQHRAHRAHSRVSPSTHARRRGLLVGSAVVYDRARENYQPRLCSLVHELFKRDYCGPLKGARSRVRQQLQAPQVLKPVPRPGADPRSHTHTLSHTHTHTHTHAHTHTHTRTHARTRSHTHAHTRTHTHTHTRAHTHAHTNNTTQHRICTACKLGNTGPLTSLYTYFCVFSGYPHGDGDCLAPGCDVGPGLPVGEYLFDHRNANVSIHGQVRVCVSLFRFFPFYFFSCFVPHAVPL